MKLKLLLQCILCFIPLLFNVSCEAQKPLQSSRLAEWYINATDAALDSIKNYYASPKEFDSLINVIRTTDKGSAGTFSLAMEPYNILGWKTPDTILPDTTYPLIVYLHGGTGCELPEKGIRAWDMLTPLADTFHIFLASPSADRNTPWWSAEGLKRIEQTVRFMTLHYPINPDKIFLAGVSDGATGCYAAANCINGPFAGFFAISGFGGMLPQTGMKLIPPNLSQRPIYNVNAGKDRIFPLTYVLQFIEWLKQNGVAVEHREYPDEEHGFDYRPKEFGTLAQYMRSWSHHPSSHTIRYTFLPGFPVNTDYIIDAILDSTIQSPTITANRSGDTITMATNGLRELLVSFPDKHNGMLYVINNGRACKAVKPQNMSAELTLKQMLHTCIFASGTTAIYRIRL